MRKFYRKADERQEWCFYVDAEQDLEKSDVEKLSWLLAETFEPEKFGEESFLGSEGKIIEIGPRLNFETAFSTNAVSICEAVGIKGIQRIERSRRYLVASGEDEEKFVAENADRMTECRYHEPLASFAVDIVPEKVREVPVLEKGVGALKEINMEMGLGMDDWDLNFYCKLFREEFKRNPTNLECFQLGQANSEHSRHWFFKGKLVIDGKKIPENLIEIIKSTLEANPSNSLIAFSDNSSAISGYDVETITPKKSGSPNPFENKKKRLHPVFTAETHNFPSGVAPFPGAETGTGGRIRDVEATGRGAHVIAGTAAYCTGNLNIRDFPIPGEDKNFEYPGNLAAPEKILIGASDGASDYGNKFGEPLIQGFARTFGMTLPSGERREWLKPIMFTGGVGQIEDAHIKKEKPAKGMLIIQIGGPAYRIGVGGGAASSMMHGKNKEELDFNAVQRGDGEMEQKMNRVIRTCAEMGECNPILSIHDQGAGGPSNVITELVEPAGGRVEIRNIVAGDKTMSVLELWSAEYQERNALLINPGRLEEFQNICGREKVNCEVLGKVTGEGKIVVHDAADDTTPVDLDLEKILTGIPQKTFDIKRSKAKLEPLEIPENLKLEEAIKMVFRLPSVGSKGYLAHKVDRSVTGLVAAQQCAGPLQLPVADVAVVANSHFAQTGTAISIGEQPLKMLVDARAGARMAVGETLTNLVWAKISDLSHVKCSVNWMWPAKLPGEGALIYDAADALRNMMIALGIAADGGKDSLGMAAKLGDETVKCPGQVAVSAYATVPDIEKVITPDIKQPGKSKLIFLDLASGKNRLGGSALAQVFSQVGNESPDANDPELLKKAFGAVQQFIDKGLILAGHDRSDGGLITTLAEMVMSGNCGAQIGLKDDSEMIPKLFSEELGLVIEYLPENEKKIAASLEKEKIPFEILGTTTAKKKLIISQKGKNILDIETATLHGWWEASSDRFEKIQRSPQCAAAIIENRKRPGINYRVDFDPQETSAEILSRKEKPKVAILREEGSNGDREMASAFFAAGFEPWDVTMKDLLDGNIALELFRGIVFVGGFSYADVLDSAKGWAGTIRFNERLKKMFDGFYNRADTFSLGVCNGCQLMALLGWVPAKGTEDAKQPRFVRNESEKFESRWVTVGVNKSPAIMLRGMEGSRLGIWVAHGEGKLHFPDKKIAQDVKAKNLAPVSFVDDEGNPTEKYPMNPNGSPGGFAALCSPNGRHLALMPHPERAFLKWQWPYLPENLKKEWKASPWLRMFQNAREWCENNKKSGK